MSLAEPYAQERRGAFIRRGKPVTGLGRELSVGDLAPDAELSGRGFEPVRVSALRDRRVLILSCVPSLDTPTCDIETKRFEAETKDEGDRLRMLTVSMDLPYAQERWCGASEVHHTVASAHRNEGFGIDYGVLVKETRLLARAVFVIGRDGRIRHLEYVRDTSEEPDYDEILKAARVAAEEVVGPEPAEQEPAAVVDPVGLADRYLALLEERRLEEAKGMLAPAAEIVFPGPQGGARYAGLDELVQGAKGRYRWVKKRRDHFDVGRNERGDVVVNSYGTLYGENLAGMSFEGVRYIDRFTIRDGRILQQLVWNDLAESGVLA